MASPTDNAGRTAVLASDAIAKKHDRSDGRKTSEDSNVDGAHAKVASAGVDARIETEQGSRAVIGSSHMDESFRLITRWKFIKPRTRSAKSIKVNDELNRVRTSRRLFHTHKT